MKKTITAREYLNSIEIGNSWNFANKTTTSAIRYPLPTDKITWTLAEIIGERVSYKSDLDKNIGDMIEILEISYRDENDESTLIIDMREDPHIILITKDIYSETVRGIFDLKDLLFLSDPPQTINVRGNIIVNIGDRRSEFYNIDDDDYFDSFVTPMTAREVLNGINILTYEDLMKDSPQELELMEPLFSNRILVALNIFPETEAVRASILPNKSIWTRAEIVGDKISYESALNDYIIDVIEIDQISYQNENGRLIIVDMNENCRIIPTIKDENPFGIVRGIFNLDSFSSDPPQTINVRGNTITIKPKLRKNFYYRVNADYFDGFRGLPF